MSRGLGIIGQTILGAFQTDPHNAFTANEICELVYARRPEKKHRVAVLTAMRSLTRRPTDYCLLVRPGVGSVIYDRRSDHSYRMAQAKLEGQKRFRRIWVADFEGRNRGKPIAGLYDRPKTHAELEIQLRIELTPN